MIAAVVGLAVTGVVVPLCQVGRQEISYLLYQKTFFSLLNATVVVGAAVVVVAVVDDATTMPVVVN